MSQLRSLKLFGFRTQNALKSPYCSMLLNPSRPYTIAQVLPNRLGHLCAVVEPVLDGKWTLKDTQHDDGSPRNVAFANARWWHQAEYTSTITLNAILQRHNCSCKNCHGIVHPAVQHVHDSHSLITLQLTLWEFCTCSLVLCGQRPTAPRPWSKLFCFFWNRVCCSYSLLFYRSC